MIESKSYNIDNILTISLKDSVLHAKYNSCKVDLTKAKKLVKDRKKITQHTSYPVVISSCDRLELTRDARVFLTSKEGTEGLPIIAIVHENSKIKMMLINFMLKMHPLHIPVKSFENKEKALSWINFQNKSY